MSLFPMLLQFWRPNCWRKSMILDDEIFYAGSQQHNNILLLPKAATASNLSSVGGNSTSSALKLQLVGAEYIKTVKPFFDWCKGIFDYFFYYYNCNPQLHNHCCIQSANFIYC